MSEFQTPDYQMPPPARKSNVLVWIIVLACVGGCFLLIAMGSAILFPVFGQARLAAKKTLALSHAKQLGLSMQMYTAENNDTFPIAAEWCDRIAPYVGEEAMFTSPAAGDGPGYDFAFAAKLSEKNALSVRNPDRTIMVFEQRGRTKNANGSRELLPEKGRYSSAEGRTSIVALINGSARAVNHDDLAAGSPGINAYFP